MSKEIKEQFISVMLSTLPNKTIKYRFVRGKKNLKVFVISNDIEMFQAKAFNMTDALRCLNFAD